MGDVALRFEPTPDDKPVDGDELGDIKHRAQIALSNVLSDGDGVEGAGVCADQLEETKRDAIDALERLLLAEADVLQQCDEPAEKLTEAKERAREALEAALMVEIDDAGIALSPYELELAKEKAIGALDAALLEESDLDISGDELQTLKIKTQGALHAALMLDDAHVSIENSVASGVALGIVATGIESTKRDTFNFACRPSVGTWLHPRPYHPIVAPDSVNSSNSDDAHEAAAAAAAVVEVVAPPAPAASSAADSAEGATVSADDEAALAMRARLQHTRAQMATANAGLKAEVDQLSSALSDLEKERDTLKQRLGVSGSAAASTTGGQQP